MAETQSTNLKLDLVDGDSNFDTDKVKSNFEKIDTAVGELTEKMEWTEVEVPYNTEFDLTKINFSELSIRIVVTNGSYWHFDFLHLAKKFVTNEYMIYYNTLQTGESSNLARYKIKIQNNTIKLYECYYNSTEYDKSYLRIYYR